MKNLNIPVGVSDFTEIRKNGYYYIDKSGLIKDILKTASTKVTLITRPRRFGKTLAMSMLDAYFDIRKDSKQLFDGLEISQNQVLCSEWMNKYPTIFVSFRQVEGLDFKGAYDMLTVVIANLFNEHIYLLDSKKATEFQKTSFKNLLSGNASVKEVKSSIYLLMNMMNDYYNESVILLIDEYDVPVAKANNNGYYNETGRLGAANVALNYDMNHLVKGLKSRTYVGFNAYNLTRIGKAEQFAAYIATPNADKTDVTLEKVWDLTEMSGQAKLHDYYFQQFSGYQTFSYDRLFNDVHGINTALTYHISLSLIHI